MLECPVCHTRLHLELGTTDAPVDPADIHDRRVWDDAVVTAELREATRPDPPPRPGPPPFDPGRRKPT